MGLAAKIACVLENCLPFY